MLHSLRHTFGKQLGERSGGLRVELAYERLNALNLQHVPTNSPTVGEATMDAVQ